MHWIPPEKQDHWNVAQPPPEAKKPVSEKRTSQYLGI